MPNIKATLTNVNPEELMKVINSGFDYAPEEDPKWIVLDRKFLLTALETRKNKIAELEKRWNDLRQSIKDMQHNGGTCNQRETCVYLDHLMTLMEKPQ